MTAPSVYQDTIQYLFTRLPMFSRLGKKALRANLTNITTLCAELGNPHQQFKSIHIAGTNGKGSTSHGLSAILQEAGFTVGLYTSPHLIDFRERIRINGQPVLQEWVVSFVEKHKALIESVQPSFFEITVAMAFAYFSEQKVDIAVIETGLGGRLDSTNIIIPILSIITNISYDHQDLLGNTLSEIAKEKAGIIKQGIPILLGEQQEETDSIFFEESIHKECIIHYAETLWDLVKVKQDADFQYFKAVETRSRELYELKTDLLGNYQSHNLCTILAACDILALYGFPSRLEQRWAALERVKSISGLRGRWDVWQRKPLVIADVAHNLAGIKEAMAQWQTVSATSKHILIGFVRDKDLQSIILQLPQDSTLHFCHAETPRALPAHELRELARDNGLDGFVYLSVQAAINQLKSELTSEDALLICGSFFVVGEALQTFQEK